MKLEDAIYVHKMWKYKISDYIRNPDKSIVPEACQEKGCELAIWLSGPGSEELKDFPEFHELKKVHKEFHNVLGELVFNANRGVAISEEIALGLDSPFAKKSENIIRLLFKLKNFKSTQAA